MNKPRIIRIITGYLSLSKLFREEHATHANLAPSLEGPPWTIYLSDIDNLAIT